MKRIFSVCCVIAIFFLGSCANSDSPSVDNSLAPSDLTKPVTPVTIADTLFSDSTNSSAAITPTASVQSKAVSVSPSQPTSVVQSQTVASKGAAGANPAHGLPGHRCDISVGAPLNSPVPKATSPQVQSTPQIQSTPQAQSSPVVNPQVIQQVATGQKNVPSGNSSAKLNPAHGQPGHDCAVQVVAALKN